MAQAIFDVIAEDPEEKHVAEDVRDATVHEHRSEDGDPTLAANDVCGNHRPLTNEGLTTAEFQHKDQDVKENNGSCRNREMRRPPGGVGQGHDTHSAADLLTRLLGKGAKARVRGANRWSDRQKWTSTVRYFEEALSMMTRERFDNAAAFIDEAEDSI